MTTEHDEALVERVASAIQAAFHRGMDSECSPLSYDAQARAAIYPPAPPKTRLQVARELLAKADTERDCDTLAQFRLAGRYDTDAETAAVMAALALPAMED